MEPKELNIIRTANGKRVEASNPIPVIVVDGSIGGGGSGGPTVDRELVVTTYIAKAHFSDTSVGDTVTCTQIIDVSGELPVTVATIWRNQSAAFDYEGAPDFQYIELLSSTALTDAQLRASAIEISNADLANISVNLGAQADDMATTDSGEFSLIALIKRILGNQKALLNNIPSLVNDRLPVDGSGVTQPVSIADPIDTGLEQPLTNDELRAAPVNVTANAGTNLNTSALAVEEGGNLETAATKLTSLDTKTPALGQAAKAGSVPVTLASDQGDLPISNSHLGSIDDKLTVNNTGVLIVDTQTSPLTDGELRANPVIIEGAVTAVAAIDQTDPGNSNRVSIGTNGAVAINAPIPAGANIIGKVSIDQTTDGATNKVNIGNTGVVTAKLQDGGGNAIGSTTQASKPRLDVTLPSNGATGAATPAVATLIGASDGTNLQPVQVDANRNLKVAVQNTPASSGNIIALNGTVAVAIGASGSILATITGTWVASIQFQGLAPDGATWLPLYGATGGPTSAFSITPLTANGTTRLMIPAGFTQVRAIATAFTSGTATVSFALSNAVGSLETTQLNAANLNATVVNSDITALNAKTPALGNAAAAASSPVTQSMESVTGNITTQNLVPAGAATAGSAVEILLNGANQIGLQVTGTYTGILSIQFTIDGTNWITLGAGVIINPANNAFVTTIASGVVGTFLIPCAGFFRLRVTGLGAMTGTAVITMRAVSNSNLVQLTQGLPNGSYPIGGVSSVNNVLNSQTGNPVPLNDVASGVITTTVTSSTLTPQYGATHSFLIAVTAITGTTPTLDVDVQESDDNGTNWFTVYSFPRITTTGVYRSPKLPMRTNKVRYVQTVGGTTPSITRAIWRTVGSGAVNGSVSQLIDRTPVLTTLNSATGSLNIQNARNAQLLISIGAATTPPAFQLQGSDDNGATWYSIGTPLTAVASSTVQVTVVNVNAALIRAVVSTVGVGATLNYILLKGF